MLMAGALSAPAIGVSVASAHAPLQGQSPSPNSNLKTAPTAVSLLAGEQGIGTAPTDYLTVLDGSGVNHANALAATTRENSTLISAPLNGMSKGWYGVHWNISSDDGHPMGGDSGAWWAFGVNGSTAKSPKVALVARNAMPPVGTKATLPISVSGNRKGNQTITVVNKWGTLYSAKWTLNDPAHVSLNGAMFSWFSICKKTVATCTATGVLPFAGTYDLVLQVISTSKTGSNTSLWSTQLVIK